MQRPALRRGGFAASAALLSIAFGAPVQAVPKRLAGAIDPAPARFAAARAGALGVGALVPLLGLGLWRRKAVRCSRCCREYADCRWCAERVTAPAPP